MRIVSGREMLTKTIKREVEQGQKERLRGRKQKDSENRKMERVKKYCERVKKTVRTQSRKMERVRE